MYNNNFKIANQSVIELNHLEAISGHFEKLFDCAIQTYL